MTSTRSALDVDWLGICRRAVKGLERVLAESPSTEERARETGARGSGGDRTLEIDRSAESVVVAELDALHEQGYGFLACSEERGAIDYGDDRVRVILDPIDGSLNAKRGIPHHALSIAVAEGETMADVEFAFVHDFGTREEWWARRGDGAWLGGERLDPALAERRTRDGKLEVVGIESADPRWLQGSLNQLIDCTYRLRAFGSIAVALCHVASARFDGMVSLRRSRGVDAAAGQLIVREAGGIVSFPGSAAPLAAPLDASPHAPVVAARSLQGLHQLERVAA
ncbi:MAG TPA: inositol monophosphatase family protein [Solirubrobacteraceae bacterium]|jgi:myo-inositol-1(or 4)-monophosphatase